MALSIASIGAYSDNKTGTSLNVAVPSGVSSGALVCVSVMAYAAGTFADPTISGFTLGFKSPVALSAFSLNFWFYRFYKYATGADTGAYTVTKPANVMNTAYAWRVSGWTGSGNPWTDSLHEGANPGGSTTIASFTPGGANSLIEAMWLANNTTQPSGWTAAGSATSSDGDQINLAYVVQTTAAATGSLLFGSTESVVSVGTIRQSATTNTGTLSASTPVITASLTGSSTNTGSLSASPPVVTASITGSAKNAGTLSASPPVVAAAINGSQAIPGTLNGATPIITGSINGAQGNIGSLNASLPLVTANLHDTTSNVGTLNASLPVMTAAIAGNSVNVGTFAVSTPVVTATISGAFLNRGSLSASTPLIAATCTGSLVIPGALTAVLPLVISAFGNPVQRDITVAGAVSARRWGSTVGQRQVSGSVGSKRWGGSIG